MCERESEREREAHQTAYPGIPHDILVFTADSGVYSTVCSLLNSTKSGGEGWEEGRGSKERGEGREGEGGTPPPPSKSTNINLNQCFLYIFHILIVPRGREKYPETFVFLRETTVSQLLAVATQAVESRAHPQDRR